VEESVTNLLVDPDVGGLVANLRDVTGEIEGQIALQRSEARYRAIVEGAHEGILVLDKNADTMFANQHIAEMVGYSLAEIHEYGLWCAFDPDDAQRLHQRVLSRAETGPERYELPFRTANGDLRTLNVSASPLHYDEGIGVLAMVTDVTAERRAEAELRKRALRDTLTGLPNRALLADRLESAAARQTRFATRGLAVLFVDLDDMKRVNDRAGHACGDALLVKVGERLTMAVREVDTVTRLGGDEFAILCEDVDPEDATLVARRVEQAFSEPFVIGSHSFEISASIGVALSPPHAVADLLHLADKAMYEAKERARGTFLVFDSDMALGAQRKSRLADELGRALQSEELVVHYQPIVGLRDGRIEGIEALVRWQHPTLGMLQPLEVLAVARDTGMELQLDAAVLAVACRDMGRLLRDGVLGPESYVSVNLSATSAMSAPLDVTVPDNLQRAGVSPRQLVLEITETSVMADVERTAAKLRSLASYGVRIALDDFGTGYSSLAYLHRLPLDILKIDRSFVSGLPGEGESAAIIRSVLSLAMALGLHVVAEGVETQGQSTALQDLGCYSAQGYLWSTPVPACELPHGSVSGVGR
jgi:Amt family ammonium transporter